MSASLDALGRDMINLAASVHGLEKRIATAHKADGAVRHRYGSRAQLALHALWSSQRGPSPSKTGRPLRNVIRQADTPGAKPGAE
jgi:hypothetical protein